MAPKTKGTLPFLLLSFLLLLSPSSAHNITRLLSQFPDFAAFNSLLNQTGLAAEINNRRTITVLAVDGSAISAVSSLPADIQKAVLSVHVILDYYDEEKLHHLSKRSAVLTTLFQTTGVADARRGFLNVTKLPGGQIAFGSAVVGAGLTSNLVKAVAAKPYNISVLQVSSIIFPPGIDGTNHTVAAPPPPPAAKAPAPAPAPEVESSAPAADAPVADAPVADSPASDAPVSSPPSPMEIDGGADAPTASSAGRVAVGAGVGVVMGVVLLGVF